MSFSSVGAGGVEHGVQAEGELEEVHGAIAFVVVEVGAGAGVRDAAEVDLPLVFQGGEEAAGEDDVRDGFVGVVAEDAQGGGAGPVVVGLKVTMTTPSPPAKMGGDIRLVFTVKSPLFPPVVLAPVMASGPVPVLRSVKVFAVLAAPRILLPKSTVGVPITARV